jgi:AraC-like DNA-binding protein
MTAAPARNLDALSDVLGTLKLASSVSSRFEGRGRWACRFAGHPGQIKFGNVVQGRLRVQLEGEREASVFETGDFYLLTTERSFISSSLPAGAVEDGPVAYAGARGPDGVVRYGREGDLVVLRNGRFAFEGEASRLLLQHLPPLVKLRAGSPGTQALAGVLELLGGEEDATRPGAAIARSSLATLVLVQALRLHLASTPQPAGWLAAVADPRLGRALAALHGDLRRPWTVESLAREAGLSRTAFAVRFRERVGSPPLDYLTHWRMTVARGLLAEGGLPVATVAERVGYQSDTAFSAAFKRATGASPARFRDAANA